MYSATLAKPKECTYVHNAPHHVPPAETTSAMFFASDPANVANSFRLKSIWIRDFFNGYSVIVVIPFSSKFNVYVFLNLVGRPLSLHTLSTYHNREIPNRS